LPDIEDLPMRGPNERRLLSAAALAIVQLLAVSPAIQPVRAMEFAYMPAGLRLPVVLTSRVNAATAKVGDPVIARVNTDVQVGTKQRIQKGTMLLGHVSASKRGGARSLELTFDQMRLKTGTMLPISARIANGPTKRNDVFILELKTPAQVAVEGSYL
jgi:hypothetical protein